jgi:NADPH:quinone reductase-like Zn-dependent oxidoreductase
MRAVQITRFGGPEVMEIVDLPEPAPGEGQQLYDVSSAGVNFADTHQGLLASVAAHVCSAPLIRLAQRAA